MWRGLTNGGLSCNWSALENRAFSGLIGAFSRPIRFFRGQSGPIPPHLTARGKSKGCPVRAFLAPLALFGPSLFRLPQQKKQPLPFWPPPLMAIQLKFDTLSCPLSLSLSLLHFLRVCSFSFTLTPLSASLFLPRFSCLSGPPLSLSLYPPSLPLSHPLLFFLSLSLFLFNSFSLSLSLSLSHFLIFFCLSRLPSETMSAAISWYLFLSFFLLFFSSVSLSLLFY